MNIAFTICAKNYLASALTLKKSIEKVEQSTKFYIVLADEKKGLSDDFVMSNQIIPARDLGVDNYEKMAFCYDVIEFNTAVKPFAFRWFLTEKKADKVVYLDPDIYVYRELDDIWNGLNDYSIILTPHVVDGRRRINHIYDDPVFLQYGVYNLGFAGVSAKYDGKAIIDWWCRRLEENCVRESPFFVDQKWMDMIPALFDRVYIDREKKYNLARWNFGERQIDDAECRNVYDVFGKDQIIFIHFSNFRPGDELNIPYVEDAQLDIIRTLYTEYEKQLLENDYCVYSKLEYAYNYFSNGERIQKIQRKIYAARMNDSMSETSPFDSERGEYYEILKKNGLTSHIEFDEAGTINSSREKEASTKKRLFIKMCRLYLRLFGIIKYQKLLDSIERNIGLDKQGYLLK